MSSEQAAEVCASCGRAEVDDIKLKKCTACKVVKYCGVDCQKNHRKQHKKECKKRAAEIRDDQLFKQPEETHLGECPICCLPLPLELDKSRLMGCCSKFICLGCFHANAVREREGGLEHKCAYCREPLSKSVEEADDNNMKRVKANDPVALRRLASNCHREGDNEGALKYWTKAAGLNDIQSHYHLSCMYREGLGVEIDLKKGVYHLEEAAIGGHPQARCNLGAYELDNLKFERAMKHFIIAAKLGSDPALNAVKKSFERRGFVSKEDHAAALREHQAAVDATKSEQREEAYAFFNTHKLMSRSTSG
jgi:hypothetical protein